MAVPGAWGCDWLDSTSSASAGGKDADPMLLEEETDTSTPSSGECSCQLGICRSSNQLDLFVSVSHQTGLDTWSMTRRSVYSGVKGEGGQVRGEARALLDYADHRLT